MFFFFANFWKRMQWKQFWSVSFDLSSHLPDINFWLPAFWRYHASTTFLNRSRNWQKPRKINRCEINMRFIDNIKISAIQTQQINNWSFILYKSLKSSVIGEPLSSIADTRMRLFPNFLCFYSLLSDQCSLWSISIFDSVLQPYRKKSPPPKPRFINDTHVGNIVFEV